MKRIALVLPVVAVLGLSACGHDGSWTPVASDAEARTYGHKTVEAKPMAKKTYKADKTYSTSMQK